MYYVLITEILHTKATSEAWSKTQTREFGKCEQSHLKLPETLKMCMHTWKEIMKIS